MVDMLCNRNKIIDIWNGPYAMYGTTFKTASTAR